MMSDECSAQEPSSFYREMDHVHLGDRTTGGAHQSGFTTADAVLSAGRFEGEEPSQHGA